jgi:two-component system CitB family sensor kinase
VISEDTAAPELPFETRDLVTVIGNLIDNAVDAAAAAPRPRRVAVSLRASGDEVRVRISDSGAGIDPDRVEDLFTRGWTTKNESGHGIGLALVRRGVQRLGGTIEVAADAALGGTAMIVRLPRGPAGDAAGDAAPGTAPGTARREAVAP